MTHLIDKAALVAEIKARISSVETSQKAGMIKKRDANKKILLFKSVLSLIDTLEVKEVGIDLGDPKGDKSAKYIIDTKTLEVKEVQEEPVSEDLEEAADNALNNVLNAHEIVNIRSCLEMFKYGAQWKEKEMQSTIELAEDHAMLADIEKMKEQMMAEAIDVEVKVDAGGYPYIDKTIELYDYDKDVPLAKAGDKYKVVLIKKD